MRKTDERINERVKKVSKVDERKEKIREIIERLKKMNMEKLKEFSVDLKHRWDVTNKDFEVRIDGANKDIDRLAMSLLWDKNSRKIILMDEINQPRRIGSYIGGLSRDFITLSEELMVCYVTALKNNENLIEELNYFIGVCFGMIEEQEIMIDKLKKKEAPKEKWEEQYKIEVYNELKSKWGDNIGHIRGKLKQTVEQTLGDDVDTKKRKKEIINEEFKKIEKEFESNEKQ